MTDGSPRLTIDYLPCGLNGSATLTARLEDDILGHAKVDLGKPKARAEFVESLKKGRSGIDGAAVERELMRIGAELSACRAKAGETPLEPSSQELLYKMPEHIRHEARAMLESADLMKRVIDDVVACGVAGERELVATIYLIGVSRLLERPLAAIVQAPSSTGKSYVLDKTAALFPSEAVIHATSMTAQSLYYFEAGALQHKFIIAGERSRREDDETAEATRALREMIGSGRLTKLVPMKEGGRIVTQRIEQPGPIAYIETTTLTKIFDEDANRCLLLSADEREQQTRIIVNRIAATYARPATATMEMTVQRHHAAQRMIQQRPVSIPFADRIAEGFNCERVEARRAIGHLLSMIEASAVLHQLQRQLDSDGRIVANSFDYELARQLCGGPLARLLGLRITDAALRFYDRLTGWATDLFTTSQAAIRDRKKSQTVRDLLKVLCEAGAVEQVEPGRGSRPATWRLTGMDRGELVSDCGLPLTID
jgi:hypothetical protein